MWAAVTPACAARGRAVTCYRCDVLPRQPLGLVLAVSVTSMYSVITGRRVDLLSLGPILYSATRSTASVRYESGARNFSGCRSGVAGTPTEVTGRRGAISTRGVGAQKIVKPLISRAAAGVRGTELGGGSVEAHTLSEGAAHVVSAVVALGLPTRSAYVPPETPRAQRARALPGCAPMRSAGTMGRFRHEGACFGTKARERERERLGV